MPKKIITASNKTPAESTSAKPSDGIQQTETDNAKLLQVQIAMQRENQVFTSVSNVLKTKHDTTKNSIGNIK